MDELQRGRRAHESRLDLWVKDFAPGQDVHVAMTKWGGARHWTFDARGLGSDEHGHWLGQCRGDSLTRPGAEFVMPSNSVLLCPRNSWFVATFYAESPPGANNPEVYVDVASVTSWSAASATAVDLDLDVVRRWDGSVFVDDEDEFREHQRTLGYPPEVISAAQASCEHLVPAVTNHLPPFDDTSAGWLDVLAGLAAKR
jgi:protein associated with RNAse G/E